MTPGEILYYDLLGIVLVFAADAFHLWDPWTRLVNHALDGIRARVQYRRF
jgi:hypothetical protein